MLMLMLMLMRVHNYAALAPAHASGAAAAAEYADAAAAAAAVTSLPGLSPSPVPSCVPLRLLPLVLKRLVRSPAITAQVSAVTPAVTPASFVPFFTSPPLAVALQEIEEFCKTATGGASEADPFEGLSPQEIDEYIEKHGLPAAAQL